MKKQLRKNVTLQEWYITYDYIIGEYGDTERVNSIQSNIKSVPMPPPHLEPQPPQKTAQEGNGASTVLMEVSDNEILNVTSTVVADPVVSVP